jgi:hypothetical protein
MLAEILSIVESDDVEVVCPKSKEININNKKKPSKLSVFQ